MSVRRFLPANMTVADFFAALNGATPGFDRVRYVVPRWFENLPHLSRGEDIDLLVYDEDEPRVRRLLRPKSLPQRLFGASRIKCDVKTVSSGYYPKQASMRMIDRASLHPSGARVPNAEDYFYSLAYHALYHKGMMQSHVVSHHDYAGKLRSLAHSIGLDAEINRAWLAAHLDGNAAWRLRY